MPNIQLLDGKKITFTNSINGFDIIKKISKSLEKCSNNRSQWPTERPKSQNYQDSKVRVITSKDKEGLEVLRHDAAHIMAMAVQVIPWYQVTIGPVIENGFYYDFARRPFTSDDLNKIEKNV